MGVEELDQSGDFSSFDDSTWFVKNEPINGTDSRRRLESRIDELRLLKELREFDFE